VDEIRESPIQSGLSELENIFQEYKSKLERAEKEANEIINLAWQKAEEIIADKQKEAQQVIDEAKKGSKQEADRIMSEAKIRAAEIEKEAAVIARKNAKEKTKGEVDKIIADTKQTAEKQSSEIVADAKREAEEIVKKAKESAQSQVIEESEAIISEAREKAKKIDEDSATRAEELRELMVEISQKAGDVFNRFEKEVQAEVTNLTVQLDKARGDLEISGILERIGFNVNENKISSDNGNVKGRRELNIMQPYDRSQIKKLLETLKQIPSVRLDGQTGTEENYSIYLNIVEPIPLLSILQNLSIVESSDDRGDTIKIKLKYSDNGL
jgi:F0F1-type ATP synthase membrane subunit b/b'